MGEVWYIVEDSFPDNPDGGYILLIEEEKEKPEIIINKSELKKLLFSPVQITPDAKVLRVFQKVFKKGNKVIYLGRSWGWKKEDFIAVLNLLYEKAGCKISIDWNRIPEFTDLISSQTVGKVYVETLLQRAESINLPNMAEELKFSKFECLENKTEKARNETPRSKPPLNPEDNKESRKILEEITKELKDEKNERGKKVGHLGLASDISLSPQRKSIKTYNFEDFAKIVYPDFLGKTVRKLEKDLFAPFYKFSKMGKSTYLFLSSFEISYTPNAYQIGKLLLLLKQAFSKELSEELVFSQAKLVSFWERNAMMLLEEFEQNYLYAYILYRLADKGEEFIKIFKEKLSAMNIFSEIALEVRASNLLNELYFAFAEFCFVEADEDFYIPLRQFKEGFRKRQILLVKELIALPPQIYEEIVFFEKEKLREILKKLNDYEVYPPNAFLSYLKTLEKNYAEITPIRKLIQSYLEKQTLMPLHIT